MVRTNPLSKKKGADQILTVYWFVIIFIVAGAVVYMAYLFYGSPFDARNIEGSLLGNQIANCLTNKGYIIDQAFLPDFQNNFLQDCHLNFSTEDFSDWKTNTQYYAQVVVYKFNSNAQQQSYGESDSSISSNIGNQVLTVSAGNINLKTAWELITPSTGFLGLNLNKRNVNTIVIHDTEGPTALGAIQAISTADLSIHYIIDRDGTIISPDNVNQFAPAQYANALVPESTIAQDAGCYDTRSKTQWPICSATCTDSNGLIATSCQKLSNPPPNEFCCLEFNVKSIGIELVNLGNEPYPDTQIKSLINLVSDISSRYNIPLDRAHIVGHYQTSSYKVDPGTQFPWDTFIQELTSRGAVAIASSTANTEQQQRNIYALDKSGNQYVIQILTLVGKTEKNV